MSSSPRSARGITSLSKFAVSLLVAGTAVAADRPAFNKRTGLFEPPFSELERAVARKDRAELGRWAGRFGPSRLGQALRGTDRGHQLAALEAAPLLPGNARLLEAVTPLLEGRDEAVAEAAAHAAGRMLDRTEPGRLADWDIPVDVVTQVCAALATVVSDGQRPAGPRLAAIEARAEAGHRCVAMDASALLFDPVPEIRRAALLVMDMDAEKVAAALADPEPSVAAAAAVATCRHRRGPSPRLREIARAVGTSAEDKAEILPCASGDGS